MKLKTLKTKSKSLLICRVCGDIARGINFSVITCMSCKMFFRRHAQSQLIRQKCHFNNRCIITKKTRKFCLPCRLRRCFTVGMNPQLIRCLSEENKIISPTSLCLINKNHSILSLDEWNLLTNIINTYDEQKLFLQTKDFLQNQFSLPPKIRSKTSNTLNHISSLFFTIYTFMERCPLFNSLPAYFRKQLIERNLNTIGSLNGFFIAKEMKIFENETYSKYIDNIYGNNYSNNIINASQRLEENGILIKIMLMILIFSSNCGVVTINQFEHNQLIFNIKLLNYLQNIFITLLWKFLIYQYGFHNAILRLLSLVKSILDLIQRINDGLKIEKHWMMIENIIEKTTETLNLNIPS